MRYHIILELEIEEFSHFKFNTKIALQLHQIECNKMTCLAHFNKLRMCNPILEIILTVHLLKKYLIIV